MKRGWWRGIEGEVGFVARRFIGKKKTEQSKSPHNEEVLVGFGSPAFDVHNLNDL